MRLAAFVRDIIYNNPPLTHFIINLFSLYAMDTSRVNETSGEMILEALLNSSIQSI